MNSHRVVFADSRDLSFIERDSVHLTVTSPPYVTTEYHKGQEFPYRQFFDELRCIFAEIYRVLVPDGRFALNVADVYTKYMYPEDETLYKVPLSSDMLQLALSLGFRQLDQFIWDKGFTRNFGGPLLGSFPYPMTLFNNVYYEFIYILKKPGKRRVCQQTREESRLSVEEWRAYVQRWWRIESESERFPGHPAVFPLEIPSRLIAMYSYVGDLVLDPFLGSGTTVEAAMRMKRNSIGIERDPKYQSIIAKRLGGQFQLGMFEKPPGRVVFQRHTEGAIEDLYAL